MFPGGGITGTIGGGNVEFECQRLAAELLERGGDALRQFRFTLGDAASLGMVCGGGVTVQFQYLPAGEQRIIAVLRDLIEADGGNRDTWLLRRIEGEQVTAMGPGRPDRAPSSGYPAGGAGAPVRESGGLCPEVAVHPGGEGRADLSLRRRTCVSGPGAGAGFPGLPPRGVRRPAGVRGPALFPKAEKTLCGDFAWLSEQVTVTPEDYVVVMTRGHQADYEVLTQVLRSGGQISWAHWLQEEAGPVPGAAAGGGVHRRGVRPPSRLPSVWPSAPRRRRRLPCPWPQR